MATTKNIQSIERAFSILELFQKKKEELSLKEISNELSLNKSTAFGLINTLTNIGYLQQNKDSQKYSLGFKVLSLTNSLKLNNILIRVAHPFLEELAHEYHETIHSAIEFNNSIIYLDKVEADTSIYINTQMGTKNYIPCTGVGKCILAYLPENKKNKILNGPLKKITYNTIIDKEKLEKELEIIKKEGYAMENEEIEIGLSCIAVPIFSAKNEVAFAISISGPTQRIQEKKSKELINKLQQTARNISKILYSYSDSK